MPIRLDVLQHANVVALAAAKFHSAAVTAGGKLLTWGWGRGGRLGELQMVSCYRTLCMYEILVNA